MIKLLSLLNEITIDTSIQPQIGKWYAFTSDRNPDYVMKFQVTKFVTNDRGDKGIHTSQGFSISPKEWNRANEEGRIKRYTPKYLKEIEIKPEPLEDKLKRTLFTYFERRLNNPDLNQDDRFIGNYEFSNEQELKELLDFYFETYFDESMLPNKPFKKLVRLVIDDMKIHSGFYDKPDRDLGGETTGLREIEIDTTLNPQQLLKFLEKHKHEVLYELGLIGNKRGNPERLFDGDDFYFELAGDNVFLEHSSGNFPDDIYFASRPEDLAYYDEEDGNSMDIKGTEIYYCFENG